MEDFTRELTPGNTKAAMKAVGAASSDLSPDLRKALAELLKGIPKVVDGGK